MLISYYVDLSKSMPQILLVHRFRNNYTTHLSANPIAQIKKPQRSPLRLRFFICTLESASCAIGIVIYETMYQSRGYSELKQGTYLIGLNFIHITHSPLPITSARPVMVWCAFAGALEKVSVWKSALCKKISLSEPFLRRV